MLEPSGPNFAPHSRIALAKERGAYKGRAKRVTPDLLAQAKELLAAGHSASATAKDLGVSRASLYRWFKEAGEPLLKKYEHRQE